MTIKQLQYLLLYLGYDSGIADGIWGQNTHNALMKFQQDYSTSVCMITVDGYPGEETYKALRNAVMSGMKKTEETVPEETESKEEQSATVTDASTYLQEDGLYHIPRGVEVRLTEHFTAREIHCQCGGYCKESKVSKRVIELAEMIRQDLGEPITIATSGGSGYRCPQHNANIPGASSTSLHMVSDALDLHYRNPSKLKQVAKKYLTNGEIGLYSWGCHVGCWDKGYLNEFDGGG